MVEKVTPGEAPLSAWEQYELERCEKRIKRGQKTFQEVGAALLTIRGQRLYRATHTTFEHYCRDRLGWTRQQASQLILAAERSAPPELSTAVDSEPLNERQARADLPAPRGEPAALVQMPMLGPDRELTTLAAPASKSPATFNRTNDNVDWAWWTWNPVTGCLHDCDYCYARDIATRFYPQGFAPTFLEHRLAAPKNTRLPHSPDPRSRRVFTCSMADLFGKWVPQPWIDAVFAEVRDNPQWEFLFLTKFPQRLAEIDWPENAWVGTTVDRQYRVEIAEKAFRGVKAGVKWLSCEPLLEPLKFSSLEMFDLVVIGGASKSTRTPEFWPPYEWVRDLEQQARAAGSHVYMKPNTFSSLTPVPQELPRTSPDPDAYAQRVETIDTGDGLA